MRRVTEQRGFTIIELMIALVILGIVTAQVMVVFGTQRRTAVVSDRLLDVQEGARTVIDLIAHDVRMAGMLVPREAGVSSFDGGTGAADRLCVSDASYFNTPLDGSPSPSLDNRGAHFSTAEVTAVTAMGVWLQTLDVDGAGNAIDFLPGDGIIISNGNRTHCGQIVAVIGNQINIDPAHMIPGGLFPSTAGLVAAPAIIYELDEPNLTLTRNGVTLATSTEDLQVEYWVDNQLPDGLVGGTEFPIHDLNASPGAWLIQTDRISRVRVSVVARTEVSDGDGSVVSQRYRRPASANRTVGATDQFRRRRFSVSITPRNLF